MRDFFKDELFIAGFVAFLVFACGFILKNAEDKEKSIEVNQTVSEKAKKYTEILKARVLQTSYDDLVFEFPRNFQPVKNDVSNIQDNSNFYYFVELGDEKLRDDGVRERLVYIHIQRRGTLLTLDKEYVSSVAVRDVSNENCKK